MKIRHRTVQADVESKVRGICIILIQCAVTMTMKHHGPLLLLIPGQHRIMAHHYLKDLFEKGIIIRLKPLLHELTNTLKLFSIRKNCVIMIPFNEILSPGQFLQQLTNCIFLITGQISKQINRISAINRSPPHVKQPRIVLRDILLPDKRSLIGMFQYTCVTEMKICCEEYSIHNNAGSFKKNLSDHRHHAFSLRGKAS